MTLRTKWIALFCVFVLTLCTLWAKNAAYGDVHYTVKRGDTLWGLGQIYHTTVSKIVARNHLHGDLLQIHQHLFIPSPYSTLLTNAHHSAKKRPVHFHKVEKGESLWSISLKSHVSVDKLKLMNNLYTDTIYPGEKLVIDSHWSSHLFASIHVRRALKIGVPRQLIPVYQNAGRKYGIPWMVLAAIHHIETNFSMGYHVSSAGALGPMQFMPTTFAIYGVCAPGERGRPDINNVYDAIYSAAHMLKDNGYARSPIRALYAYNHSSYYVESVRLFADDM